MTGAQIGFAAADVILAFLCVCEWHDAWRQRRLFRAWLTVVLIALLTFILVIVVLG